MDKTVEISVDYYNLLLSIEESNKKCRVLGLSELLEQIREAHPEAETVDEGLGLCSAAELEELIRGWTPPNTACGWWSRYRSLLMAAVKRLKALEQKALEETTYAVEEVAAGE